MAELLIMIKDNSNPDHASRYYKGDIVEVREDGFAWGNEMSYFGVLKIPDLDPLKIEKYMLPELELNTETLVWNKIKRRRIWNLLIDDVPVAIRQEFVENHEYTITPNKIKDYIKNKITGLTDDDLDG